MDSKENKSDSVDSISPEKEVEQIVTPYTVAAGVNGIDYEKVNSFV